MFHPGDKVRCIDATSEGLIDGAIYTIELFESGARPEYDLVKLQALSPYYFADRFELEQSVLAIGCNVIATDTPIDPLIEQRRELKRLLGDI